MIPTPQNLNIPALKCYIACFNICLNKRDSTSEIVSYIMGHPVYVRGFGGYHLSPSSSSVDNFRHCLII